MKRIQSACLLQTVRFQQREPMPRDMAEEANCRELERYQQQMSRSYTRFKICEESVLEDGTIEIKLKKQYNGYDLGGYLGE